MRRAIVLLALASGACTATDSFDAAQRSLLAQDLPRALVAFDAVPLSHPRYPEARATALSVERRLRRSHELLLEALLLRAEWRDREALVVLGRVADVWPRMPGLAALRDATEHRVALLGLGRVEARPQAPFLEPTPAPPRAGAAEPPPEVDPAPAEVTPAPLGEVAPGRPPEPTPSTATPVGMTADGDPVVLGLVAVETRLGRGDLEAAVVDLIELAERFPDDARVARRLARVLHQRALQRYGHGHLTAAIVDWERVTTLDPTNKVAKQMLAVARAEAAGASPPR